MNKRVAVLGSLTIDLFLRPEKSWVFSHSSENEKKEFFALPHGTKMEVSHLEEQFGGGASNVGMSFAKNGFSVSVFGAVGDDNNGKKIVEHLQSENIDTNGVAKIQNQNSGFSAIISAFDGERTVLFTSGANLESPVVETVEIGESIDLLYLCHLASKNTSEIFDHIIQFFQKNPEKMLAWNPGKEAIDKGVEANEKLLSCVDILFLNREEAEKFTGESAFLETSFGEERRRQYGLSFPTQSPLPSYVARVDHLAQKFLEKGTKVVVITDGRRGAQVFSTEEAFFLSAFDGKRVDTLGAGDAFASTFSANFLQGKSLRECAKYASIQAASVVEKLGAQPGLLPDTEIQNRFEQFQNTFSLFSLYP